MEFHNGDFCTSSPIYCHRPSIGDMTRMPTMSGGATFCHSAKRHDIAPILRSDTLYSTSADSTTTSQYDTELEDEAEASVRDVHGVYTYKDTCERLGILPIRNIIEGLETDTIKVHNRSMTAEDTLAMCDALRLNRCVRHVSLEGNNMGDAGAGHLADYLIHDVNLKRLNVSNNFISSRGIDVLLDALMENKDVYRLNLSSNEIKDENTVMLVNVLQSSKSLIRLNLSHNNFGDRSCEKLSPAIASNDTLMVLDLSWNKIHTQGAIEIFNGLTDNVLLKKFRMSMSAVADDGAIALAHCLQRNSTLLEVDVSYNRISDKGAGHIAKGLLLNETLKKLIIHDNPMTANGLVDLLRGLKRNPLSGLRLLDVSPVPIHDAAHAAMTGLRKILPKLVIKHGARITSRIPYKISEVKLTLRKDPFAILKDYITSKGYRLIDFFKQFDKDGSGAIDRKEFIAGVKSIDAPLSVLQLDALINKLDKDGNGEIDFQELAIGEKELRMKERAKRTRQITETRIEN